MSDINYISALRVVRHYYRGTHKAGRVLSFSKNCIGYVKHGSADFLYKGRVVSAGEGDLVYIPLGTEYYSVWSGDPDIEFYQIEFDFQNKLVGSAYGFEILHNYPPSLPDSIFLDYKKSPMSSLGRVYLLLSDVYSKISAPTIDSYKDIEPAVLYIEKNYRESVSIPHLAALCNMSVSGFFKKFKAITGVSPINYKHNLTVQHSLELLSATDLTVEEVSYRLGFSSPNYFRRVFFKVMRKSPGAIRVKKNSLN